MTEKDLSKPLYLEKFNNFDGFTYKDYAYRYNEALENVQYENSFEKELREYCESIFKVDLPYYIKYVTKKRSKVSGCYTIPGSKIEVFQAKHKDYCDSSKISIEAVYATMLHEYAHFVKDWVSRWDNEMHGVVFESVLFNLRKLAKTKGLYYAALDVDNDHFHNRMKKNIVFEPVCERMGLDPKVMLNDNDVIVTDNPNKLVYIY